MDSIIFLKHKRTPDCQHFTLKSGYRVIKVDTCALNQWQALWGGRQTQD